MPGDAANSGLADITVAKTRLSAIDGAAGELVIGGFPLEEIAANATYEESVYLLLKDRLPTAGELSRFRRELADRRAIGAELRTLVRRAATDAVPAMDALRMGMAAASLNTELDDRHDAALRSIAVCPTIVACYWRGRVGEDPLEPRDDLGHAANYLYMLTGEEPPASRERGLETYLNTVIDHGLNASTFTARAVVSTESDPISAATAAVGALKGPLHGGAPGPVLDMLRGVHEGGDPEGYVRETLAAGERLMGFGHRVYDVRDPRAEVLSTASERFFEDGDEGGLFDTARELERVAVAVLADHKPDHRLETNVEFYTATLLAGIGIPKALFSTTFAVSRVGGWMAHCLEQLEDNRIIRPRSRYVGVRDRTWVPIDDR